MGNHPLNLTLRFILELIVFASSINWVWNHYSGLQRNMLVVIVPILIGIVWGCFAVPNDPSRSGDAVIAINGVLRLALEAFIFALGVWFLYQSEGRMLSLSFAVVVIAHYIVSYDRIAWLIKQ